MHDGMRLREGERLAPVHVEVIGRSGNGTLLAGLEPGARLVVRGLAGADGATSRQLGADIDRLLTRSREPGRRARR